MAGPLDELARLLGILSDKDIQHLENSYALEDAFGIGPKDSNGNISIQQGIKRNNIPPDLSSLNTPSINKTPFVETGGGYPPTYRYGVR